MSLPGACRAAATPLALDLALNGSARPGRRQDHFRYAERSRVKYQPRGEVPAQGGYFTLERRGAPEQRFPISSGRLLFTILFVSLR